MLRRDWRWTKEIRAELLVDQAGPGALALTGPILHSQVLS